MEATKKTIWRRLLAHLGVGDDELILLPQLSLGGVFYFIAAALVLMAAMLAEGGLLALQRPLPFLPLLLDLLFFAALAFIGRLMLQHRLRRQVEAADVLDSFVVVGVVLGVLLGVLGSVLSELVRLFVLAKLLVGYPLVAMAILLWLRMYVIIVELSVLTYRRLASIFLLVFALYLAMQWLAAAFALETVLEIPMQLLAGTLLVLSIAAMWRVPWLALLNQKIRLRLLWKLPLLVVALAFAQTALENTYAPIVESFLPGGERVFFWIFVLALLWALRLWIGVVLLLPAGRLLERRAREVETLTALTKTLSREFDIRKVAEVVTRAIPEISNANAAWITLREQPAEILSYGLLHDHIAPFLEAEPLQQRLRQITDVVYVQDLAADRQLASLYLQVGSYCRSLLVIPLRTAEQQIQGYLWVVSQEPYAFRPEDIRLLLSFSESIGIAFERARLFEEAVQKQRYQQELEIARQIQMRLLPMQLPNIPGIELAAYVSPALEVGGDYYDVVRLQDGRWCILVGDVSGKGVSAALYMAELKGSVMALAQESQSPKELLAKVNRVLGPTFQQRIFITLLAVALDPQRGQLSVARAGHPPLLLCSGNQIRRIQPQGIGIGLVPPARFETLMEEQVVVLEPQSAFLLYTDGAFELHNADGEDFGFQRLEQTFLAAVRAEGQLPKAEFVVGGILRALSTFSAGQPQFDDITLLAGIVRAVPLAEDAEVSAIESAYANGNRNV